MCGILAVHGLEKPSNDRPRFIALSKRLRHRGPDWSGCFVGQDCVLVHERLAIVGVGELVHYLFFSLLKLCQILVLSL
jgi:asparagine synthase (glutamine-hydrolysing)